jgi:hypothetical protein
MSHAFTLAIDPGLTGALALLDGDGQVELLALDLVTPAVWKRELPRAGCHFWRC